MTKDYWKNNEHKVQNYTKPTKVDLLLNRSKAGLFKGSFFLRGKSI